jgi:hypothetical protein
MYQDERQHFPYSYTFTQSSGQCVAAQVSDESLLHPVPAGETDAAPAFPSALLHKNCDVWFLLLTQHT